MRRALTGILLAIGVTLSPVARADDSEDIRAVISGQLEAFKAGDAEAAYGFAAPGIRQMYPTADSFMAMVERGYGPVFASATATFGPMAQAGVAYRQDVFLSDSSGKSWIARYALIRGEDGELKIAGVTMRAGTDIGI